METLALMLAAVGLSLLVGIPLGIARRPLRPRSSGPSRPVLDAMQIVPGVRLPDAGRDPVLGRPGRGGRLDDDLRDPARRADHRARDPRRSGEHGRGGRVDGGDASPDADEGAAAARAPDAALLGVNQTILFALSMVVIAGLIGGGGLGAVVTSGLYTYPALAILAGFAIVIMAMALDRVTEAIADRTDPAKRHLDDAARRRCASQTARRRRSRSPDGRRGEAPRRQRGLSRTAGAQARTARSRTGCSRASRACSTTCRTRRRGSSQITEPTGNTSSRQLLLPFQDFLVEAPWFDHARRADADRARRLRAAAGDHDVRDARRDRRPRGVGARDGHAVAGARRDAARRRHRRRPRVLGGGEPDRLEGSCARSTTCCRRCRSSSTSSRSST